MENPETPETPQPEPAQYSPPPLPPAARAELPQKSPVLAMFLSLLPGLGNVYNGLYRRGITLFLIWAALLGLTVSEEVENPFLILCIVFIFVFSAVDAYRQATLINYGLTSADALTEEKGTLDNIGGWGLIPGVALVALGLYGLLRKYFDIDLGWILDQWPWVIIGFGGWMIYQAFQQRKSEEDGGEREVAKAEKG